MSDISMKLVTLLALLTGYRIQTLKNICISNIRHNNVENQIEIHISDKIRTLSSKAFQPFFILPYFAAQPNLSTHQL